MSMPPLPTPEFRPAPEHLLVLPDETLTKTEAGLFLVEGAKKTPVAGRIVVAGPGRRRDDAIGGRVPAEYERGERVIYGRYAGVHIQLDKVGYVVLRTSEILATVGNTVKVTTE